MSAFPASAQSPSSTRVSFSSRFFFLTVVRAMLRRRSTSFARTSARAVSPEAPPGSLKRRAEVSRGIFAGRATAGTEVVLVELGAQQPLDLLVDAGVPRRVRGVRGEYKGGAGRLNDRCAGHSSLRESGQTKGDDVRRRHVGWGDALLRLLLAQLPHQRT
eukprot:7377499-Prymnesium_polylepis.1